MQSCYLSSARLGSAAFLLVLIIGSPNKINHICYVFIANDSLIATYCIPCHAHLARRYLLAEKTHQPIYLQSSMKNVILLHLLTGFHTLNNYLTVLAALSPTRDFCLKFLQEIHVDFALLLTFIPSVASNTAKYDQNYTQYRDPIKKNKYHAR